jgi:hypothetical protein
MTPLEPLIILQVYDVYEYDSWEYNGGENKELNK